MKPYRARALIGAHMPQHTILPSRLDEVTGPRVNAVFLSPPPPPKPAPPNRAKRRELNVLNKKLAKRFKKDGTPATVTVQPDGGIHVNIGKPRTKVEEYLELCGQQALDRAVGGEFNEKEESAWVEKLDAFSKP